MAAPSWSRCSPSTCSLRSHRSRWGEAPVFTVEAVPAPELGNASFLVADRDRQVALVIDPLRDVAPYLKIADRLGVKVTHALDTHLHNDFVSGRRELQAATGTNIGE